MKYGLHRKKVWIAGVGLVCCLLTESLTVSAANGLLVKNILPTSGAASLLDSGLSEEEYISIAQEAQGALWGYTNLGIADVESGNLNVRESPSTDSKLVGKMPKNAACEIISTQNGWAQIVSGEVSGYVNLEFLLTGPDSKLKANELVRTVALVKSDGLRVRDEASFDSAVLTQVPEGEELEYVETIGEWIKVSIDGEEAYVHSDYVEIDEKMDTAITMTELLYGQGVSDIRVDLAEYAKQFIGNPYVWGGTSLTKGADCSGFVLSVFAHYGIRLSHSARAQANEGTKISISDLKPGDLVFYANSSGSINHVAIYIGGGKVVHASSSKTGIKTSNYNYRTPVKAVSILYD